MPKFLLVFLVVNCLAADGLSDFKAAIGRYEKKSTLRGTLEVQTSVTQGKGKDATEIRGRASASVDYSSQGLRMQWSRPFLQQLDQEAQQRTKNNTRSDNQASNALWAMELRRTYHLLDAAGELSRMVDAASFLSEGQETLNGRPVRVLQFSLPQSGAPERFRRWISEFTSTVKIWIDAEGNPISFRQNNNVKYRAFLVISFEQTQETNISYSAIGDHLVSVRHEEKQEGGGAGEYGSSRTIRTFRPQ